MTDYRMYNQAFQTLEKNKDIIKEYDIVQPYNFRCIQTGISPCITTRPEGLKTCILIVEESEGN